MIECESTVGSKVEVGTEEPDTKIDAWESKVSVTAGREEGEEIGLLEEETGGGRRDVREEVGLIMGIEFDGLSR